MKRVLLLIMMACACLMGKAEESTTNLVVWAKDGTRVAYALAEQPKVTFTETDLVITAKGVEVNYALANMSHITYDMGDNTSIRDLKTGKTSFHMTGETLLFPALSANSTVMIHTLNGASVFSKTVLSSGEYSFPLSNLPAGVYLVTVNGLTYKILKK